MTSVSRPVVAIIPARKGSKGLPNKNLKVFKGKPLIAWSIESALKTNIIDKVFVSTDCEDIANLARKSGALVPFIRPAELANDSASMVAVLKHFIEWFTLNDGVGSDEFVLILLQPTSPLRYAGTLQKAVRQFLDLEVDSLVGIVETHKFRWVGDPPSPNYDYANRLNRQDIPAHNRSFYETGSIYVFNPKNVLEFDNVLAGSIVGFKQRFWEGFEIDDIDDWVLAELIYEAKFRDQT